MYLIVSYVVCHIVVAITCCSFSVNNSTYGSFQEFLVKYEESTKIVTVDPENCDDLKSAILRRFKVADDVPVVMQIFLRKYNEYVDVEPGTEVFDGAKILLKRTR